jgi:hypothetical protein
MLESSVAPVVAIPSDVPKPLTDGIALSLSGGGYRAMLFHVGSLWRLAQLGILSLESHTAVAPTGAPIPIGQLQRVSSVSGGSIEAAQLALRWQERAGPERDPLPHRNCRANPPPGSSLPRRHQPGGDRAGARRRRTSGPCEPRLAAAERVPLS